MPLLPSRLDLYGTGRRVVIARAKKIDPATIDVAGSDANIVVASSSFMGAQVIKQLADGLRNLTLDAEGEQLDRVIMDRYQLPRKGAQAAVVPMDLSRSSFIAGGGTLPIGTKFISLGGIEYVSLTPASFGATQLEGVTCDARAVQAGFAFQVGANQIRRLANPGLAFDPSIIVNNAVPAAGGTDRELDPQYANRARRFWLSARRGTLSAIEQGALEVPGVDSAYAQEQLVGNLPTRIVMLTAADLAGVCNAVLAARIREHLLEFRAGGITVVVLSSAPQLVAIELALTFVASANTTALADQVRLAVTDYVNSLGANQVLRRGDLFAVLTRYRDSGLIVTNDSIALPLGDLVPDSGKTLRCRFEDVTLV